MVALAIAACGSTPSYLPRAQLLDPSTCKTCHPMDYADWSGSMHAYASDDPVFLAMNARGQRETHGALGPFCVRCHAPMAFHEGATTDGLNLATVPQDLKGVTCFFCHDVASVQGTHDNPLQLASDIVMRGEYTNPMANSAHPSTYSGLLDRNVADSATLCGSCHDIVNQHGAAIERTFAEWQGSVYAHTGGDTCGECHMAQATSPRPISNVMGSPPRLFHSHTFPAVDEALTPFPQQTAQQDEVDAFLATTLQSALCVLQSGSGSAIRVVLENVAAGHGFPSGAAQDRRVWVEVVAYKAGAAVYRSGVVPAGTPVTQVTGDPDLWLMRDCMFDASGNPVDMFWQAASYESNALPAQLTFDMTNPAFYQTHVVQYYPRDSTKLLPFVPDMVTLKVHVRPVGLDVLDDLVKSGDLDPKVAASMPTYDLDLGGGPVLTWTPATANGTYEEGVLPVSCITQTALNVAADKVPAVNHMKCSP